MKWGLNTKGSWEINELDPKYTGTWEFSRAMNEMDDFSIDNYISVWIDWYAIVDTDDLKSIKTIIKSFISNKDFPWFRFLLNRNVENQTNINFVYSHWEHELKQKTNFLKNCFDESDLLRDILDNYKDYKNLIVLKNNEGIKDKKLFYTLYFDEQVDWFRWIESVKNNTKQKIEETI
jgi:uncharacterized protein YktA (UPF0223 family)